MGKEAISRADELATRVSSLLHTSNQAEKIIAELEERVKFLRGKMRASNAQLKNQMGAFEQAMKEIEHARKVIVDLKAENRTMRMAIRGLTLPNLDRLDDPLSDGCGSVTEASIALVAETAPVATKAKKKA